MENRQDQAEGLRTRMIDDYRQENGTYPSRSEIHKRKDKKTKRKMKYPIISILALFFILLPVFILSMNLYYSSTEDQDSTEELNIGENRVYISKNQASDNESAENVESQNSVENIEKESEENSSNQNEQVGTEETEETTSDSDGKQNESEEVLTPSDTTDESTQTEDNEKDSQDDFKEIKTHKVATGETLFSIAIKYYNNRSGEEIIRQYNNLVGNEIYVGQTLKIPIN